MAVIVGKASYLVNHDIAYHIIFSTQRIHSPMHQTAVASCAYAVRPHTSYLDLKLPSPSSGLAAPREPYSSQSHCAVSCNK